MRSITRRRMLRGLGGLAIAAPFLPSLDGESRADAPVFPKRFVYVSNSCGEAPSNWWPNRDRFEWTELEGSVREAPLGAAAGQGGLNKVLGPDFDDLLHKMIFLRGLDLFDPDPYGGHIPPCALNAARNTARLFGTAVDGSSLPSISSDTHPLNFALRNVVAMRR